MYDGLKLRFPSTSALVLLASGVLAFVAPVAVATGEVVRAPMTARHRGMTFILKPSRSEPGGWFVEARGSLHVWARDGGHNSDRFGFAEAVAAFGELCALAGCTTEAVTVHNLEVGVNLYLPFEAARIVSSLVALGSAPISDLCPLDGNGREVHRSEYLLKVYDKGMQLGVSTSHLARLEWKAKKAAPIRRALLGPGAESSAPVTVADLCSPEAFARLGAHLVQAFGAVTWYDDSVHEDALPEAEAHRLERFTSRRRWQASASKDERHQMRKGLARLVEAGGGNDFGDYLGRAIACEVGVLAKAEPRLSCASTGAPDALASSDALSVATFCPLGYAGKTSIGVDSKGIVIGGSWEGYQTRPILPVMGALAVDIQGIANVNKGGATTAKNRTHQAKVPVNQTLMNRPTPVPNEATQKRNEQNGAGVPAPATACLTCGSDISHQRAGSLYCATSSRNGRRCRDRARNIHRAAAVSLAREASRKASGGVPMQASKAKKANAGGGFESMPAACMCCGKSLKGRRAGTRFCVDPLPGGGSRCRDRRRRTRYDAPGVRRFARPSEPHQSANSSPKRSDSTDPSPVFGSGAHSGRDHVAKAAPSTAKHVISAPHLQAVPG